MKLLGLPNDTNSTTVEQSKPNSSRNSPRSGSRGGNRRNRRETAVDEGKKEMADRVARYQADYIVGT